jgi:CheY-like chemotaxis protein
VTTAPTSPPPGNPPMVPPNHQLRVVVADNDPDLLELVATDLVLEGHDVVAVALSGEEAVDACARYQPDVLIVDYRMPPGLNGVETIAAVRQAQSARACILYSNYRSSQIASATRRLGAMYVKKGPLRSLRAALLTVDAG